MEKRPFGRTGLEVSAVGFGCWEIGGGYSDIEAFESDTPSGVRVPLIRMGKRIS